MSTYAYTAEREDGTLIGGCTVEAEPVVKERNGITFIDYRPVFAKALEDAVAKHGDDVFIAEIVWSEP